MKLLKIIILLLIFGYSTKSQDNTTPIYMQAGKAFRSGDYIKAITIAKSISKNNPTFENAQLLIGYCYLELDSLAQAENTFMEVIKKNNISSQAFNGLGLVHYKRISDDKMVIKFLKNIFSESDESQAERMFLRAIKYNERYPEARFNLARLYLRMRNEVKHISAENILSSLVDENPDNMEYKLLLGQAKSKLGKFKESKKLIQTVVDKNPEGAIAKIELAFAEFKLKQYNKFSEHYLSGLKYLKDTQILLKIFQDTYDVLSSKEIEFIQNMGVDGNYYYNFWQKRDPNLITDINERLIIHFQRLEYARDNYGEDSFTGYDDRGIIYVRYGEPVQKYIGNSILADVADNESWVYKISDKIVTFDFVQRGATFSLIDDLSEILRPGIGTNVLRTLRRVYEERSHLDGPYTRMGTELSNIEVSRQHDLKIENIAPHLARHRIEKEKTQKNIPKSTFKYKLEGEDLPFSFNYAYFYDRERIRLELYYGLRRSDIIAHLKSADIQLPEIIQKTSIHDYLYNQIVKNKNIIDLNKNRSKSDIFTAQHIVFITKNFVRLGVQLECEESKQKRSINLPINIPEFQKDKMNVSSIQFSKLIRRKEAADDTTALKNGLMIQPYPFTEISKSSIIYLYFEIYNLLLDESMMGEYEINLKIYRDEDSMDFTGLLKAINPFSSSKSESIETSFIKNTNKSIVPEYFALDMSTLNIGRYRLVVGVTDKQSNYTINRRVRFDLIQ